MNFEHLVFFHGFTKQRSPETQRPCARLRDADRHMRSASGDPAMVFIFRMASILSVVRAPCPAQLPDCCWTFLRMIVSRNRSPVFGNHAKTRAICARELYLTTNVMLFEQRLVTRLVLLLVVIEKRTARRHQLQKATTRMVVLHVGLEMPGEVVDAFRQDCDLNLGRAGVAGLGGIRLDDFRFAFGGNRHRQTLPLLRAELAISPVRLNTRLGMSSPLPISARARSRPATVT